MPLKLEFRNEVQQMFKCAPLTSNLLHLLQKLNIDRVHGVQTTFLCPVIDKLVAKYMVAEQRVWYMFWSLMGFDLLQSNLMQALGLLQATNQV